MLFRNCFLWNLSQRVMDICNYPAIMYLKLKYFDCQFRTTYISNHMVLIKVCVEYSIFIQWNTT